MVTTVPAIAATAPALSVKLVSCGCTGVNAVPSVRVPSAALVPSGNTTVTAAVVAALKVTVYVCGSMKSVSMAVITWRYGVPVPVLVHRYHWKVIVAPLTAVGTSQKLAGSLFSIVAPS